MSDKGIIFSASMVRAKREGRKTQTRRLISPQPPAGVTSAGVYSNSAEGVKDQWSWLTGDPRDCDSWEHYGDFKTGYRPGDRLYVRETWACHWATDDQKPSEIDPELWSVRYYADDHVRPAARDGSVALLEQFKRKRVAIFMPRWASRMWLEVTEVRVQRLQDITEADCIAEGPRVKGWAQFGAGRHGGQPSSLDGIMVHTDMEHVFATPRCWYRELWDSLHTKPGERWEDNPWVVAVSFEVHHGNIDAAGAA